MKLKTLIISLFLIAALLLAGCGKPGAKKTNPSEQETEASSGESLADQNRFLCSIEQRAVRIGDVLYFSDHGANHLSMIFAVDLNTMECFPLCGKPECEHNSAACGACAGSAGPVSLEASEGKLYYLDTVYAPITGVIYQMEPDGSGRTEITRLNRDLETTSEGKSNSWFGIYAGKVYRLFCGDYMDDAEPRSTAVLYAQPLESDSADRAEELLRVEGATCSAACIDGHFLYFCVSSVQDAETRFTVYAYDLDAETLETLYSGPDAYSPGTVARVGDDLLFGYGAPALRLSLTDRSLTELPLSANRDDVIVLGQDAVFFPISPDECRCVDYAGNLLYEGPYVPDELRDSDNTKLPLGFTDGWFFFLMASYAEDSVTYHVTSFQATDHTAKLLYSARVQNGNLFGG